MLHISGIFGEEKSTKNEQYYFDSKKSAATLEFDLTLLDTSKTWIRAMCYWWITIV